MKRIWDAIKNNLSLKVIALVFAVILWSNVIADENPKRDKIVRNVPVVITGAEALEEKGLVVPQQYVDELNITVSVRVTARNSDLSKISVEDILVYADLSKVKEAGTYPVELKGETKSQLGEVAVIKTNDITIGVARIEEKEVPITYELMGKTAPDKYAFVEKIEPETIKVSGAEGDLKRIEKAQAVVSIENLTEDSILDRELTLLDRDDNTVRMGTLQAPELFAKFYVTVLPVKNIPIAIDDKIIADIDTLPEGYRIESITADINSAAVVAPASVLNRISSLSVEKINIEATTSENYTVKTKIVLPQNVHKIDPELIRITVKVVKIPEEGE